MAELRPLRVRFAPSPSGSLHLGNARTALFNWLVARQSAGRLVLRIEDTDVERRTAGAEQGILEDLRWLGLGWDEGPDREGPYGPYRQSERGQLYRTETARLIEGGQAYRCFCDERRLRDERERRRGAGLPPHYSGRCRALTTREAESRAARGEPFAVRFHIAGAQQEVGTTVVFRDRLRGAVRFDIAELGDPVILRRDGRPTYNFAVVVDDAAMRIDRVIRGDDHLSNTPRQVLLYRALGHATPEFVHLPLVRGEDGERLSKRHGAMSVAEYRQAGYPADGLLNALALLGWSPGADRTLIGRDEMVRAFDINRVGRSPAAFDRAKLEWICARHVQQLPAAELTAAVHERLTAAGRIPQELSAEGAAWVADVAELLRPTLSRFDEVGDRSAPLFAAGGEPSSDSDREGLAAGRAPAVVDALAAAAANRPPRDVEAWKFLHAEVARCSGAKGKSLFRPIRLALTGRATGPELDRMVPLIARGAELFPEHVASVAARAEKTARWLAARA